MTAPSPWVCLRLCDNHRLRPVADIWFRAKNIRFEPKGEDDCAVHGCPVRNRTLGMPIYDASRLFAGA